MPGEITTVAYLTMLPLDEARSLNPKFEGGMKDLALDMVAPEGHLLRGMNLGGCIRQHRRVPRELLGSVPTCIVVKESKGENLPDFGLAPWGGWGLVSQVFVDIVEELEPGVNQFLPIADTVDRKGRGVGKRYFLMNILQQINAIDVERSSVDFLETNHSFVVDGSEKRFTLRTMRLLEPHTLVLKRSLIAGHHLWRGTTEDIYHVFLSDALHHAVKAANLSPLEHIQAEEV
jgi:hypothetical protein